MPGPYPKNNWKAKLQEFFDPLKKDFANWINHQWNIRFEQMITDVNIQGSPERTLSRAVIKDRSGTFFLIEKFSKEKFPTRMKVAQTVSYLNGRGLQTALSYQKTIQGEFLPFFEDDCFGVSLFLSGTELKRPDYLMSGRIGDQLADFLIHMDKASKGVDGKVSLDVFSIKTYIYKLFTEMEKYDGLVHEKFLPFLHFLERSFMDAHDNFPMGFCHGDLHPLNVIWKNDQLLAVIDWEFTGIKPQVFDAANLVGCAGIENPKGLALPMVTSFLRRIRSKEIYDDAGWRFFPEYVLALRFAWLSEWLRKNDQQMIEMEADFMKIIIENIDVLKSGWNL